MISSFTKEQKRAVIQLSRLNDKDSGSVEVQSALLTERIKYLTDHVARHPKDHATRRGLMMLVGKRTKLLRYVQRVDPRRYQKIIKDLGIRK